MNCFGEGVLEGPLDRVFVDSLQRRAGTESLGRGTVQRLDIRVEDVVFPVEHQVLGRELHAIRPFRALKKVHGQRVAILGPFPALGEVRQRLQIISLHLEERPRARQALAETDIDPAPALRLPGPIVPAFVGRR